MSVPPLVRILLFLTALGVIGAIAELFVHRLRWLLKSPDERSLLSRASNAVSADGLKQEQRSMLSACSNCHRASLTLPFRDGSGRRYCSEECLLWVALGPTEFCPSCTSQTTSESAAEVFRGGREFGIVPLCGRASARCPTCHSVVRRVWYALGPLPVFPLGRYRTIHSTSDVFRSRRVKTA
jgi:hypothetical protein